MTLPGREELAHRLHISGNDLAPRRSSMNRRPSSCARQSARRRGPSRFRQRTRRARQANMPAPAPSAGLLAAIDLSPTTVIAGAANDAEAMPSAVRRTIQEARVSIVAQPGDRDAPAVKIVMM